MTTTRILIAASMLAVASSFAYAGPGIEYWTQRRATQTTASRPAATAPVTKTDMPCCRVVKTQRPVASHKTSMQVTSVECAGCPAMSAGQKCPSL